jgi:3-hydroxyisobutyrate dehydrogenase-like beta-hydroxyacid dehydrogenase
MRLAFIGFGEVGYYFARDLAGSGLEITAYRRRREMAEARARETRVRLCATLGEALDGAEIVLSCVWPHSALEAARDAAPFLRPGQLYGDLNSTSPGTAQRIYEAIARTGAGFAKLAIMAGVTESEGKTPIIAGGPDAARLAKLMNGWGMNVRVMGEDVRVPAAFKIVRAYGLKAILAASYEMARVARRYGIEEEVLASAGEMLGWSGYGQRMGDWIASLAVHAGRRAQEMDEAVEAITDVGLDPRFAHAIRRVFEGIAASGLREVFGETPPASYRELLDALDRTRLPPESQ